MAFPERKEACDNSFLRKDVEERLRPGNQLDRHLDPQLLPIAGLRTAIMTEQGETKKVVFRELLSPYYRPVVIFDLDDTVWSHAVDLVKAISYASGVEVTEEDLRACGHTLHIPKLQTPEIAELQKVIQDNKHPDVNPFANRAHQRAVETVHAAHAMGHLYAYLTGRKSEKYAITKRSLEWNGLPFDPSTEDVDARTHAEPKMGYLYCSRVEIADADAYKNTVVNSWLRNLRSAGWLGNMIIVDDTPKAFKNEIENGDVIAIAPDGPLNHIRPPLKNEIRVDSWYQISEFLAHYHGQALIKDPSPVRVFDCGSQFPDLQLMVRKDASGPGYFKLKDLPRGAYSFYSKTDAGITPPLVQDCN